MDKTYRFRITDDEPRLRFKLPQATLDALKKRAKENGRDLNIEIMMRLARSLEKDVYRDENDKIFEKVFFIRDEDVDKI